MSLSTALNILNSAFVTNAAQSAVISNNVTNASTTGYNREIANVVTNYSGGASVVSVTREANTALLEQVNTSTSQASYQQALSDGLTTLANTVSDSSTATSTSGAQENGNSPSAMLANLQSALETYDASPTNASAGQGVVTAAQDLASSLKTGAAAVYSVQEQADSGMSSAVDTINTLLTQFTSVNATIASETASGADISSAEDTRDNILTQLSQQIGISTVANPDGSTSIYTDSGATLFQGGRASTLTFTPTATYVAGTTGQQVMVDGVAITGSSSPMAIQSGALAGYADLRDEVAPQYGAQLDQIADGLISAFAESDQTGGSAPTAAGLFTAAGATDVPSDSASDASGLASNIEVNPAVDPSQGGSVGLLRDGGINGTAYVSNTTGGASYTGRIEDMINALTTAQPFDNSLAKLATSNSLTDYADSSVSWLQNQNQQATNKLDYETSVVSQAKTALSNATGVNLDTELTNMLSIENSYETTSKLLTTADAMFNALIQAMPS
jgi:flagellar hook-associated protein 1 FlgK